MSDEVKWRDAKALHDRIEELEAELHLMKTSGIIEVAVRNPNVMEYIRHWEGRAEAAEAIIAKERGEVQKLQAENEELESIVGWMDRIIDRIEAEFLKAEDRIEELEAENKRWRELADWYDAAMEKHVTQTGKPARISDASGVWHDGPAADMAQKILRGLQDLFRAARKGRNDD